MELNVFERLLVRNILPQVQGMGFGIMESSRILLETMFTEKEAEDLQIKVGEDGKSVTWKTKDEDGNDIPQVKDCQVSKGVKRVMAEHLIKLNDDGKLAFEHVSLFKKFVDNWEDYLEKED